MMVDDHAADNWHSYVLWDKGTYCSRRFRYSLLPDFFTCIVYRRKLVTMIKRILHPSRHTVCFI